MPQPITTIELLTLKFCILHSFMGKGCVIKGQLCRNCACLVDRGCLIEGGGVGGMAEEQNGSEST